MNSPELTLDNLRDIESELELFFLTRNKVLGLSENTLIIGELKNAYTPGESYYLKDFTVEKLFETFGIDVIIDGFINLENGYFRLEKNQYQLLNANEVFRLGKSLKSFFTYNSKELSINPLIVFSPPFIGVVGMPILLFAIIFMPYKDGHTHHHKIVRIDTIFAGTIFLVGIILMIYFIVALRKVKRFHLATTAFTLKSN